jgi:hypothetical protein
MTETSLPRCRAPLLPQPHVRKHPPCRLHARHCHVMPILVRRNEVRVIRVVSRIHRQVQRRFEPSLRRCRLVYHWNEPRNHRASGERPALIEHVVHSVVTKYPLGLSSGIEAHVVLQQLPRDWICVLLLIQSIQGIFDMLWQPWPCTSHTPRDQYVLGQSQSERTICCYLYVNRVSSNTHSPVSNTRQLR